MRRGETRVTNEFPGTATPKAKLSRTDPASTSSEPEGIVQQSIAILGLIDRSDSSPIPSQMDTWRKLEP